MNHDDHEEDYEDYDDEDEDISDRDADLEDVREQVAELTDGYEVLTLTGYGAVVAEFCWSRLKREEQDAFLAKLKKAADKNALLVLLDEIYVEGVSNPVARTDAQGNTYEMVTDDEGQRVERPMSYPTDSALRKRLTNAAKEIRVARWEYFWVLTCRLK
jgi:YD repeat-containing protein